MSYSNTTYKIGEVLINRSYEEFKILKILDSIYILKNLHTGDIVNYSSLSLYLCLEKKIISKYKIV